MNAIIMIEEFTSGAGFEDFRSNPMAVAAVERKLQVISEAGSGSGAKPNDAARISHGAISGASETSFAMHTNE
jgi:hypothetical protein